MQSGLILTPEDLNDLLLRAAREGARQALAEQPEPTPFLDVAGAAAFLSTTEDAVRSMVKRRQLPAHRTPTGRVLFTRADLEAWVTGEAS